MPKNKRTVSSAVTQINFFTEEDETDESLQKNQAGENVTSEPIAESVTDSSVLSDTEIIESEILPEQSVEAAVLTPSESTDADATELQNAGHGKKEPRNPGYRRRESLLISFFTFIVDAISRTVRGSFFASLFTSYDKVAELFKASFLYSVFSGKPSALFKSFKKRVRRLATDSVISKKFSSLVSSLLLIRTRIYGLILLSFGISSLFAHFFINQYFSFYRYSPYTPFIAIGVIVASLFLVVSGKTLSQALLGSRIFSAFSFKLLGFTKGPLGEGGSIELLGSGSVVLGLLLGLLTVVFPIKSILLFLLSVIYAIAVVKSPEAGLISLFLLAPFASLTTLTGAIAVISVSYIFKVICGKRTLMLEFPDLFVGIFILMLLFGGVITFGEKGNVLTYVLFTGIYFIAASILRSNAWFKRSVNSIILTEVAVSVYAVIARFLGEPLGFKLDVSLETDVGNASAGVLSSFSVLSYFVLVLGIFLLAYLLVCKQRLPRFLLIIANIFALAFMLFTLPKGAWLAAVVAYAVLLLLWNSRTALYMILICILLPFLPILKIYSVESFIDNMANSGTRYELWNAVMRMLGDFGIGGIGLGKNAFSDIYSAYFIGNTEGSVHAGSLIMQIAVSLGIFGLLMFLAIVFSVLQGSLSYGRGCSDKSDFNRIICYAGMCGIIASFIWGISEFIWYNPRTMLLFWLIMGVTVSARRSALSLEADGKESNLYGDTYLE